MAEQSDSAIELEESLSLIQARRDGEEITLKIAGREPITLAREEYENLLAEIRQTKWLTENVEFLEELETVMRIGGQFMGTGKCYECSYEGNIVENSAGTTLCPQCLSTNVGWPKR